MKKKVKNNREMTDTILDIIYEDERWRETLPQIEVIAEKIKTATFNYVSEHENLKILRADKPLCIGLCLSNDEQVRALNRDYRGMDKPTNVLSFANIDFADFNNENVNFAEIELGNIILAYETMKREAESEMISLEEHFCHLLTHGFLHILGYDHIKEDEAEQMEALEVAILQKLNISNPYEEDK